MDNGPGIQAATHCEITIMHNVQNKEDSTSVIFQLTNHRLNLFRSKVNDKTIKSYLLFIFGFMF